MLYLVIFLLFAAILIFVFLINVNIIIKYHRTGNYDDVAVSIFMLGGLIKINADPDEIEVKIIAIKFKRISRKRKYEGIPPKNKENFTFDDIYEKIEKIKDFYKRNKGVIRDIKRYFTNKIILKELNLDLGFGLGDAFYTGIISGVLWSLAGTAVSYVFNNIKTLKKHVNIHPNFNEKELIVDMRCIFSTKLAHIIVAGIKIFIHSKRKQKFKTFIGGDLSG